MAVNTQEVFSGIGDVEKFITMTKLYTAVKGYDEEKTANYLAQRLDGVAFDVYMRLPADDKKDITKISEALLQEFKCEQRDRENAVAELSKRKRLSGESA